MAVIQNARGLAERARAYRLHLGWTQRELAERAGIAFATLKVFERTGQISLERLLLLARALGATEPFDALFRLPEVRTLSELERPQRRRGRRSSR